MELETVTVSEDFRIVLPPSVRDALDVKPGQKLWLFRVGEHVEIARRREPNPPIRATSEYRGMLRGIDTDVPRDDDRV